MAHNVSGAGLTNILGRLGGASAYHPLDAQTFSDWTIEAGDIVTVSQGEKEYTSPVHSARMVWKGTPEVTLQSTGRKEREPISKVSKKKYGRGGGGIRQGQAFYHDIYDENGLVHSEISNTEQGFTAKLSGVVDRNGNVTAASIATAINAQGQAGVGINGAWVKIDGTTTINDVMTITDRNLHITVPLRAQQGLMASEITLRSGSDSVTITEANAEGIIKSASVSGNVLTLTPMRGDPITFNKAVTLSGEWNGNVAAGKSYKVIATQAGSTVATHYSPQLDGMYPSGNRVWSSDYSSFTQNVRVYDEDGEDLLEAEVDFYVTEAYNHAMSFQLGKMVPFIGDQANEAYNGRKTSITSNGTYYACAEGYKSRTEGYDNANYSSDRYASANPFTVNVPNTPEKDTVWTSSGIPSGAVEWPQLKTQFLNALEDGDNFCLRVQCGSKKTTFYCET